MKRKITTWSMMLALLVTMLMTPFSASAKTLYLDAGGSSKWDQGGAWFSAWVWGSKSGDAWYKATKGDVYYEIEVPDDATGMKWVRFSKVATKESWTQANGDTDGYWNQTGDLTIGKDNLLTIKGWGTSLGTDYAWSTYTPPTPDPEPEPEDPDQPVTPDPEDPDQPVTPDPEDPDTPVDPEDPDTPVDPEDPDQPVTPDPEDPDTPVDPEDPDTPVDPEDPDTPVVPDPEEPEEPAGITFTVQVPAGTVECYVAGNPSWSFVQMEKVEGEENLFTVTTTELDGTAWKYSSGAGWAYVEKDANGNEISDRKTAGNPDVVAKWALLYEPDAEPIEPYYAIRGLVSWDMADDIKLTANAEGTEYSIKGLEVAEGSEFKVIYVDENVNITWYGVGAVEANPEITQTGTDNIVLAAGKYDIYFKTATKTMWIGLTPEEDPDTPVDPEDPDTPVDPEDPDTPVDPEDPDTPVDPEDPDQPVDPEDPDTPVVPDPEEPEEPAGITFTVQVPAGTVECYVAGNPSWSFVQMEKVEGEENLFTVTTTELDGTAWKYSSGAGWAYVEKDANGNEISDRKTAGNPDVVAKWALLYEPDAEPIEPYYAIRGLVSWDMADDIKLTANAEGTEYSIKGLEVAEGSEFKVIYVDENVNITWYGVGAVEANPEITQTGTDNIILAAGKYDIYFKTATETMWIGLTPEEDPDTPVDPEDPDTPVDPEDPDTPVDPEDPDTPVDPEDPDTPVDPEDPDTPVVPDPEEPEAITFTVQVPEGTIECYITGADLWNTGGFLQMEKVEGEENLFTITTTELKGTEWKYASGPSWDYVEKDANGEEIANRTEAGNPDVVASWLAIYNPEPEEPTAVDEAESLNIYANEGTIYADAEIAIYNLAGVDVTAQNGALYGIYIVKAANGASLINVW